MIRSLIRKIYWSFKHIIYTYAGTRLYRKRWARREKPVNLASYDVLNKDHHRGYLLECISTFQPFLSLIDIGCGAGPAVLMLAKRYPEATILGIDINSASIDAGRLNLGKHNIRNAKLYEGDVSDLSRFEPKSVDVAFTDGVLLYIGPEKIDTVIREMIRIARKGLIFFEFHDPGLKGGAGISGRHTEDGFVRNYQKLLENYEAITDLSITKIPAEVFPTGRWPRYGCAIKITLR